MSVGAAEILPGAVRPPGLPGRPRAASRRARRWRCSGGAFARIAWRWPRSSSSLLLIVVALAAPLVVAVLGLPGPYVQNPNLTNAFGSPLGPSLAHPFGVDQLGRDVMSRVIYGTRVSLEVGVLGTAHRDARSASS